ncbi:MAG: hypothetical protein GEEBNDBF_01524 [bacterium]|nr:hypothetical protein [bacterium]
MTFHSRMRWLPTLSLLLLATLFMAPAHAAVSCSLNDPDRDVRKAFPTSSGYRTEFKSVQAQGGPAFRTRFEKLYGRGLDTYAEYDIQHAFYPVLQGKELTGYLFGATQKGKYGSLQVIAITDPQGKIRSIYYQRLSAPYSQQLKDPSFLRQFEGLSLDDFRHWPTEPSKAVKVQGITAPSPEAQTDLTETLWGLKKVLMLFDHYYQGGAGLQRWASTAGGAV